MKLRLLFALLALASARLPAEERSELTADWLEMVSTEEETRVTCVGNVVFTGTNLRLTCARLELIASRIGELDGALPTLEKFKYLLATGDVRMVQGGREATCGRAEVLPREDKLILSEDPVLLDRDSDIVQRGSRMTLWRAEHRVEIENPQMSGPPIRDLGPDAKDEPTPAPPTP